MEQDAKMLPSVCTVDNYFNLALLYSMIGTGQEQINFSKNSDL